MPLLFCLALNSGVAEIVVEGRFEEVAMLAVLNVEGARAGFLDVLKRDIERLSRVPGKISLSLTAKVSHTFL